MTTIGAKIPPKRPIADAQPEPKPECWLDIALEYRYITPHAPKLKKDMRQPQNIMLFTLSACPKKYADNAQNPINAASVIFLPNRSHKPCRCQVAW